MCGIVGAVALTKQTTMPTAGAIADALEETSLRGTDATGVWSSSTGVVKDGKDAKAFVVDKKKVLDVMSTEPVWIGHCRAATRGKHAEAPPSDNRNNHPFETERWILVHNGVLTDTPELKKYKYDGACDSEIAIAMLERFGPEGGFKRIVTTDSASLVAFDKKDGLLYFWRNKNPLCYAISADGGVLYFGSTVDIIDAMVPGVMIAGFNIANRFVAYSSKEHEMLVIKPTEGLVHTETIKPSLLYELKNSAEAKEFEFPVEKYAAEGKPYGWDYKRERETYVGRTLPRRNRFSIGGGDRAPVVALATIKNYTPVWSGRLEPGFGIGNIDTIGEFLQITKYFEAGIQGNGAPN